MIDEKRQRLLCEALRTNQTWPCKEAADEIERLAAELANANRLLEIGRRRALEKSGGLEIKQSVAQSDAERDLHEERMDCYQFGNTTTPPRPDASAGLVEAADYLEKEISQYGGGDWQTGIRHGLQIAVKHLRARAADRSAK